MCFAIRREIKRYHIHCDIKLKILAAVKWKRMPGQARTVRLQPLAPALLGGFPFSESALPLHMN